MHSNDTAQKSFTQSFVWVSVLVIILGAIFAGVGIAVQFIPINPATINVRINGVRQPPTMETVRIFRMVFLLVFGLVGVCTLFAGGLIAGWAGGKKRLARRLQANGRRVMADAVDYAPSAVHINNRRLGRLRCSYVAPDGTTYIFRSPILRSNPIPFLRGGQVAVYHDPDRIDRYFVDVDGSATIHSRIVEL